MSESMALGFWAKHCWAMDSLYDEDDLPEALQKIGADESARAAVNDVIEAAEADVERLLQEIQSDIEAELGRKGSPFRVTRKRSDSDWTVRMLVEPRRGELRTGPLQLVVEVQTVTGDSLHLYVWLWTKGGRATGRIFVDNLMDVQDGVEDRLTKWENGVGLVYSAPLAAERFRGLDDFAIDLDKVRADVRKKLEAQTNERLKALASALRS